MTTMMMMLCIIWRFIGMVRLTKLKKTGKQFISWSFIKSFIKPHTYTHLFCQNYGWQIHRHTIRLQIRHSILWSRYRKYEGHMADMCMLLFRIFTNHTFFWVQIKILLYQSWNTSNGSIKSLELYQGHDEQR